MRRIKTEEEKAARRTLKKIVQERAEAYNLARKHYAEARLPIDREHDAILAPARALYDAEILKASKIEFAANRAWQIAIDAERPAYQAALKTIEHLKPVK